MDLGGFRRSKIGFAAWIAVPAVLVVVIATVPSLLAHRMIHSFDESRRWMELIPEMQIRLKAVQKQMLLFSIPTAGQIDASEAVHTRINKAARQAGMVVDSLLVEPLEDAPADSSSLDKAGAVAAGGAAKPLRIFRLTVVGEGPILALTKFLADMEIQSTLTAVETAALSLTRNRPEAYYTGTFVMRCYVVSEKTSR